MFTSDMTLSEARTTLFTLLIDDGKKHECPCCYQLANIYRRSVSSTMARALVTMWCEAGSSFVHTPSLPGDTHEVSQLVWWDLIEEESIRRADLGRAGWWRITEVGQEWVNGSSKIAKYAIVYDGECLALDGPQVSIRDALGNNFNYAELMAG